MFSIHSFIVFFFLSMQFSLSSSSFSSIKVWMSFYMSSPVPVPSREESSPPPEDAGIDRVSSPTPLEAIEPVRPFINREDGSPPIPRLKWRGEH
jgi:hypothetical protein